MWCTPNGHPWKTWGKPIQTSGTNRKQQWRECEKCGQAQMRMLPWDHSSSLVDVNKSLDGTKPIEKTEYPDEE